MWGPRSIAKLVSTSNNYGKNGTFNELATGAYKPTYYWWGQ